MALNSSFGYTNKDARTDAVTLTKLEFASDYALREDEPDICSMTNTTSPIDQQEVLSFQYSELKKIPTKAKLANPLPDGAGCMWGVRLDDILRVTSTTDETFVQDLPVVCNISFKHPVHSQITPAVVAEVASRAMSALFYDAGGFDRINELMRSSLKPVKN